MNKSALVSTISLLIVLPFVLLGCNQAQETKASSMQESTTPTAVTPISTPVKSTAVTPVKNSASASSTVKKQTPNKAKHKKTSKAYTYTKPQKNTVGWRPQPSF